MPGGTVRLVVALLVAAATLERPAARLLICAERWSIATWLAF